MAVFRYQMHTMIARDALLAAVRADGGGRVTGTAAGA